MSRLRSRAQRKAAFLEAANRLYDDLENWYDQHPAASFGAIESEARRLRRGLMGQTLQVLINGRDQGYQYELPPCPECGQPMVFEDYRPKQIYGLEGDTELERAYYTCPVCEHQTVFPPRSETPTPRGSLE
jgi:hypothetical protein